MDYDIVCSEVPDEVTLAINISGCPNHCVDCHSKWLWLDEGVALDFDAIHDMVAKYGTGITCICFMGGDSEPHQIEKLAIYIRNTYPSLRVAWYSGRAEFADVDMLAFDYIKLGPYVAKYGSLRSRTTNQKLYKLINGSPTDITNLFWRHI